LAFRNSGLKPLRTFLELLERDEEKSARFFASSGSIALESITFMF